MSKRKKFSISDDINQGITEVINTVNNNVGLFRYEVIALSRIEVDPDNPRELSLSDKEIIFGIDNSDPQLIKKKKEIEELEGLAYTIKQSGVINPITVYKYRDKYRIIAGERRFLAAHIAKKIDIHARVIERKPDEIELRLLQWVENNERKDLSLYERLKNIEVIVEAYNKKHSKDTITVDILKELTGLSRTQSHSYLTVLKSHDDLRINISNNTINNLDKAVLIAGISDFSLRQAVITAVAKGDNLHMLKEMITSNKREIRENLQKSFPKKSGRIAQSVNLGRTKDIEAVKKIIELVISYPAYNQYIDMFNNINWSEYKDTSVAFHKLLNILSSRK